MITKRTLKAFAHEVKTDYEALRWLLAEEAVANEVLALMQALEAKLLAGDLDEQLQAFESLAQQTNHIETEPNIKAAVARQVAKIRLKLTALEELS